MIQEKKSMETAPQELLDCTEPSDKLKEKTKGECYDDCGCFLSTINNGFRYVIKNKVNREEDYHFEEPPKRGACRRKTEKVERVKIKDYAIIKDNADQEATLMKVLDRHPVGAVISGFEELRRHKEGIFMGPEKWVPEDSEDKEALHAILVVGYGTEVIDGKEINYWIVRNSYGEDWCDKGYFKVVRKSSQPKGTRSVLFRASYPII